LGIKLRLLKGFLCILGGPRSCEDVSCVLSGPGKVWEDVPDVLVVLVRVLKGLPGFGDARRVLGGPGGEDCEATEVSGVMVLQVHGEEMESIKSTSGHQSNQSAHPLSQRPHNYMTATLLQSLVAPYNEEPVDISFCFPPYPLRYPFAQKMPTRGGRVVCLRE
jgi:hypothetical protein